jgi:hypothetical protein
MNAIRFMAGLVVASACAIPARAADETKTPGPGAAQVSVLPPTAGGSCATCGAAGPTVGCSTCGKLLRGHNRFGHKNKNEPFQVNLCPGACFGYFQTQWRKWDDVCPYPYLGTGVSDAPKPPAPALPKSGTPLTPPRPIDPKKMPAPGVGALPAIPTVSEPVLLNKFDR